MGVLSMEEIPPIRKRHVNRSLIASIAFSVVLVVLLGYLATGLLGGSLSSSTVSSDTNTTELSNGSDVETQNITYYYNGTSLASLYENVRDSVVVVYGTVLSYSFFGEQYSEVQGSGFVYQYQNQRVVITNKHVVDGASNMTVTFSNGDAYPATVLGSDSYSDLAVLSVQAPQSEFKPLDLASSSTLKVGDPVVAIGSPFGLGGTMTTGIVSQLGRTIQDSVAGNFPVADIIQTSVPINPGNSGGPLLNYEGDVIGITTAIIQNSNSLGFAIPSNTILREISALFTKGTYDQHPWVGISGTDMNYALEQTMGVNVSYGWLVTAVTNGGAADNAGIQSGNRRILIYDQRYSIGGDIIIAIDGTRIVNGDTFMSYLEENTLPNQTIIVTIIRDHSLLNVPLVLGQRPALT
jgi:S1-C subfamily serine protease